MKCQTLKSTLLDRVLFDETLSAIRVRFRSGVWYEYTPNNLEIDVEAAFDAFVSADRPSQYFHTHIRNGRTGDGKPSWNTRRMTPEEVEVR